MQVLTSSLQSLTVLVGLECTCRVQHAAQYVICLLPTCPDTLVLLLHLLLLLAGNEPLAPGAVKLGTGSAAEAKAAAGELCSQLVMLGGELSMQSLLGPRTAAVKHVAMNRTFSAGASVKKVRLQQVFEWTQPCLCAL